MDRPMNAYVALLLAVKGKVLYSAYPRTFDGIRRMLDFGMILGVSGTSRSWKVVDKLIELAASILAR